VISPPGVVDFISVSVGAHSELVLNFADLAAYVGLAMMLRTGFLIVGRSVTRARRVARRRFSTGRRFVARRDVEREVPRQVPVAD
jgi:hypothetical protein